MIIHSNGKMRGLGDVVERIAHPIAKALHLPCLDKKTDTLRPESTCAKRRDAMNRMVPFGKPTAGGAAASQSPPAGLEAGASERPDR